jgi:hypothetical protein
VRVGLGKTNARARTDREGAFVVSSLLLGDDPRATIEASWPGRVTLRLEDVPVTTDAAPLELVLERGRSLEVELVETSGRPAPATYLAAAAPEIKTVWATAQGEGRFTFDAVPAGELELVTKIGGHVHRLRARGGDERARFTLPDHGALQIELGAGFDETNELRVRVTLPGAPDFEHVAAVGDAIPLQPGTYEVQLVREDWSSGLRRRIPLGGSQPAEVRAGETRVVRSGP